MKTVIGINPECPTGFRKIQMTSKRLISGHTVIKIQIILLTLFLVTSGSSPVAFANSKTIYSVGDVGPSGGYIAYVDDFDDYEQQEGDDSE